MFAIGLGVAHPLPKTHDTPRVRHGVFTGLSRVHGYSKFRINLFRTSPLRAKTRDSPVTLVAPTSTN
eukprot:8675909-Alexandrium_andersonii.AAC.1